MSQLVDDVAKLFGQPENRDEPQATVRLSDVQRAAGSARARQFNRTVDRIVSKSGSVDMQAGCAMVADGDLYPARWSSVRVPDRARRTEMLVALNKTCTGTVFVADAGGPDVRWELTGANMDRAARWAIDMNVPAAVTSRSLYVLDERGGLADAMADLATKTGGVLKYAYGNVTTIAGHSESASGGNGGSPDDDSDEFAAWEAAHPGLALTKRVFHESDVSRQPKGVKGGGQFRAKGAAPAGPASGKPAGGAAERAERVSVSPSVEPSASFESITSDEARRRVQSRMQEHDVRIAEDAVRQSNLGPSLRARFERRLAAAQRNQVQGREARRISREKAQARKERDRQLMVDLATHRSKRRMPPHVTFTPHSTPVKGITRKSLADVVDLVHDGKLLHNRELNPDAGISASVLADVELPGKGSQSVIVKPNMGEALDARDLIESGNGAGREVAAYLMANALGIEMPVTAMRIEEFSRAEVTSPRGDNYGYDDDDDDVGPVDDDCSVQEWAGDWATYAPWGGVVTRTAVTNESARRIALLDTVIGNEDRHAGNLMRKRDLDPDADVVFVPIDHNLTFPVWSDAADDSNASPECVNSIMVDAMEAAPLNDGEIASLDKLDAHFDEVAQELRLNGITHDEIDAVQRRIAWLLQHRRFPELKEMGWTS